MENQIGRLYKQKVKKYRLMVNGCNAFAGCKLLVAGLKTLPSFPLTIGGADWRIKEKFLY